MVEMEKNGERVYSEYDLTKALSSSDVRQRGKEQE